MKVPPPLSFLMIGCETSRRRLPASLPVLIALLLTGCDGVQSALDPAGTEAERVYKLFLFMSAGAGVIWLVVFGTATYAMRVRPHEHKERTARQFIFWGGVIFPVVVLAGLLTFGLSLIPELRAAGDGLRISVSGEQWWWRVAYHRPGSSTPVTSANEIRLPAGQRVELTLESPDVIHSLWIPSLGGKLDMIPGRTTRLVLEPTRTGTFRGVCAEFCGPSHALMAFPVVVMEQEAFDAWLAGRASPARPGADVSEGEALFRQAGCGSCHAVRGTAADGTIGPDLTHVGSRLSLGAGILPNDTASFVRFIRQVELIKPGARMPSFAMLPEEDVSAIARYLESLQ